jgi:hypothetical protein
VTGLLIAEVNINTLCELGASRGVSLRHALPLLPPPLPLLLPLGTCVPVRPLAWLFLRNCQELLNLLLSCWSCLSTACLQLHGSAHTGGCGSNSSQPYLRPAALHAAGGM